MGHGDKQSLSKTDGVHERTVKVYGQRAVDALFRRRPEAILRAYFEGKDKLPSRWGPLAQYLAKHRKIYKIQSKDDMAHSAESLHHEGVCVVIKDVVVSPQKPKGVIAVLANVSNPHNIGALYRNAAVFGVEAILHLDENFRGLTSASYRMAEGAKEVVESWYCTSEKDFADWANRYKVCVVSTSHSAKDSLTELKRAPRPLAIILGNEDEGVSKFLQSKSQFNIALQSSTKFTSLNVATAGAVMFSHC